MLLSERDDQPVVRRGRLQLKIERHAKALAQREPPGSIDSPAERRMNDQLHPAAFVEEPLSDNCLLRRHGPQDRASGGDIGGCLLRPPLIQRALFTQPGNGRKARGQGRLSDALLITRPLPQATRPLCDFLSQRRHFRR